ncbi:MAG: hypothetical protein HYX78_05545 [Armatimonadetes bacterium]|nr:hypothetical protein [Armatimonadota bacterium]
MKFAELITLLSDTGNQPYVLEGARPGKKVAISPSLVGRVMGSTVSGDGGSVLGWINKPAIERGMVDPVFNNFGGEERFWFCPESGQFGLNLQGHLDGWENYEVPDAFTTQPYDVVSVSSNSIVMHSLMDLVNAQGTRFSMDVLRTVRILDACPYTLGYGAEVDFVGFESDNLVQNVDSKPITRETGALGEFCIPQFLTHPRLVVIVPFRPGPDGELGPPIRQDYFKDFCTTTNGVMPDNRWMVARDFALFKADGKIRTKAGVGRQRAVPRLGSIDLDSSELIIVDSDFYPEMEYAASYWRQLENPYDGDAISVSIEGLKENGQPGESYELETLSPALFLSPGQYFTHRNRIFHIFGPQSVIDDICKRFLRANRETLEKFDAQS